MQETS